MYMIDQIKQLREKTGAGILDCQKALKEANGNFDKAVEILRKRGQKIALNKQERTMREGVIDAYIHSNKKIGVLIEVTCETDFVARNQEFREFVHDLAMQIAATNPQWIVPKDVPSEIIEKEKEIYRQEIKDEKKPAEIIEKIIDGKLQKFYTENCLLKQPFIKNDKITIEDLLKEKVAKMGENIKIQRFIRFAL
ncbi:MAG: translation elongation factor Ts [Patescibacteria group bacterium]